MELFLNLLWLLIAAAALVGAPRRSGHILLALVCALALLFPIVSVSDDLIPGRDALEESLAIVVKAINLVVAFVALGRIESIRPRVASLFLVPHSDPRSPPRAA